MTCPSYGARNACVPPLTVVQESCNTDRALRIFFDKTSIDKTTEYLSQVRHVCLRMIVANVRWFGVYSILKVICIAIALQRDPGTLGSNNRRT